MIGGGGNCDALLSEQSSFTTSEVLQMGNGIYSRMGQSKSWAYQPKPKTFFQINCGNTMEIHNFFSRPSSFAGFGG